MNDSFEFLKRWHQVLAEAGQKNVQIKCQTKYVAVVLQDAKNLQTHANQLLGQSVEQLEQSVKSYRQSWRFTQWLWRQVSDIAAREEVWSYHENYQKWAAKIEEYGYQQTDFSQPTTANLPIARDTSSSDNALDTQKQAAGSNVSQILPSTVQQEKVSQISSQKMDNNQKKQEPNNQRQEERNTKPFKIWAGKYYRNELNEVTQLCSSTISSTHLNQQLNKREEKRKRDFAKANQKWMQRIPQTKRESFKKRTEELFMAEEKQFQQKVESVILKQPLSRLSRIITICLSWYPGKKKEQAIVKSEKRPEVQESVSNISFNKQIDITEEINQFKSIPGDKPDEAVEVLEKLKSAMTSDLDQLTDEGLKLASDQFQETNENLDQAKDAIQKLQESLEKKCRIFSGVCHPDTLQRFKTPTTSNRSVIEEAVKIFKELQETKQKKLSTLEIYKERPKLLAAYRVQSLYVPDIIEKTFADMQSELASLIERNTQSEQKIKDIQEEDVENKAKLLIIKAELQETKTKLEETEKKVEINKRELEDKFTKELSERDKQLEYLMSYVKSQQNNNAGAKEPNQSTGTEAPRESGQNQNTGPGFFDHSNKAQVPPVVLNPANGSKPGQPLVEASENSVLDGPK